MHFAFKHRFFFSWRYKHIHLTLDIIFMILLFSLCSGVRQVVGADQRGGRCGGDWWSREWRICWWRVRLGETCAAWHMYHTLVLFCWHCSCWSDWVENESPLTCLFCTHLAHSKEDLTHHLVVGITIFCAFELFQLCGVNAAVIFSFTECLQFWTVNLWCKGI